MFKDRKDAAEKLARALEKYRNSNALVLGIPRGGVETAYYVAKHLNLEMSVVVARKLGYPSSPESAFGAIAEDGSLYLSDVSDYNISQEEISTVIERQKKEIIRRVTKFRQGKSLPDMTNRNIILTDDGIATGATLFATIMMCKKNHAARIVVAAPISGQRMQQILLEQVDEVVILEKPFHFSAVSEGYETFNDLTDEEVVSFILKFNNRISGYG